MFGEFVGKQIKVVFQDGRQTKVVRGILTEIEGGFLRVGFPDGKSMYVRVGAVSRINEAGGGGHG